MRLRLPAKKRSSQRRRQRPAIDTASPTLGYSSHRPEPTAPQNPAQGGLRSSLQPLFGLLFGRFGYLVLLIAVVASTVNVLTLSPSTKVQPIDNSQTTFLRNPSTYEAAANKILAQSIWNRNKLTFSTSDLKRQLHAAYPELSDISVTLPLLAHRPIIYVQTNQPALVLAASNGSFVLDTSGKALLRLDSAQVKTGVPTVNDQSSLPVRLNHQALTGKDVAFIQTVSEQLAAQHLNIASMSLPPQTSELDVWLVGQSYFIKFNLQHEDARQQVGTYLATINQLQTQKLTPAQYVDVRVDGRAYYQ